VFTENYSTTGHPQVQMQTLSVLKYFAFLKHKESKMLKYKSQCHWGQVGPLYRLTVKYRKKDCSRI